MIFTQTVLNRSTTEWIRLITIILASFAGLLAATQSVPVVAASFVFFALILSFTISPLSALAVLLILAPMRALLSAESPLNLPLDIGQMTVFIFVATWVAHKITNKQRLFALSTSKIYIALAIFIISAGLSVFGANSLSAWLSEWLKWIFVALLAVAVTDLSNKHRWEYIVSALVAAGVANALVGAFIFLGGSGADHLLVGGRFFRAFGTFGQPNPFGGFMGLLVPLTAMMAFGYLWINLHTWRHHRSISLVSFLYFVFYGGSACILALGVIISWSRGAWLSMVVSIGVVLIALPRKWWQSAGLAVCAVIVGSSLWLSGLIPTTIVDRIESATRDLIAVNDIRGVDITTENYAVIERLAHWQAATNMLSSKFWVGTGFGNYEVVYPDYRLINWEEPLGHAHNYYLNVLAETGIIGFLAYLIMWFIIARYTWRCRSHPDLISRCVAVGLLGTWTYLAMHSLTDNLYVNNLFLHIGVMIGLIAILNKQIEITYGYRIYESTNSDNYGN